MTSERGISWLSVGVLVVSLLIVGGVVLFISPADVTVAVVEEPDGESFIRTVIPDDDQTFGQAQIWVYFVQFEWSEYPVHRVVAVRPGGEEVSSTTAHYGADRIGLGIPTGEEVVVKAVAEDGSVVGEITVIATRDG